jgi:thiol-disulfide isomerase/thioredoxin
MSVLSKELIVYYRDGCHLCDQATDSLIALQQELGYEIKQIDIDNDPQVTEVMRKQYHADIPVVTYQDEVIFYHFFDEIAVRQALAKNS